MVARGDSAAQKSSPSQEGERGQSDQLPRPLWALHPECKGGDLQREPDKQEQGHQYQPDRSGCGSEWPALRRHQQHLPLKKQHPGRPKDFITEGLPRQFSQFTDDSHLKSSSLLPQSPPQPQGCQPTPWQLSLPLGPHLRLATPSSCAPACPWSNFQQQPSLAPAGPRGDPAGAGINTNNQGPYGCLGTWIQLCFLVLACILGLTCS